MWNHPRFWLFIGWFTCECLLSSRALSSLLDRRHRGSSAGGSGGGSSFRMTQYGMPPLHTSTSVTTTTTTTAAGPRPEERTIPRYDHPQSPWPKDCLVLDCHCGCVRISIPHATIRVDPVPPSPSLLSLTTKTTPTYHAAVDCHCPSCRKYHVADRATYIKVPLHQVQFTLYNVHDAATDPPQQQPQQYPPQRPSQSSTVLSCQDIVQTLSSSSSSVQTTTTEIPVTTYVDTCYQLGQVIRFQCTHCRTKLATQPVDVTTTTTQTTQNDKPPPPLPQQLLLLNLAAVRDETIPRKWTKQWRAFRFPWQYNVQAVWTRAQALGDYPQDDDTNEEQYTSRTTTTTTAATAAAAAAVVVTGSCTCQKYKYQIRYPTIESATTELQHCYCQLCRRLSGAPFQTWMPVSRPFFTWDTANHSGEPPIHRYTNHGRRHVCDSCGGVLTILYDSDGEEVIWPAAGGMDDATLPPTKELMSHRLYGVCHISCRYRQSWYALPNDGYPHIKQAS
jgi:hypothetical protein